MHVGGERGVGEPEPCRQLGDSTSDTHNWFGRSARNLRITRSGALGEVLVRAGRDRARLVRVAPRMASSRISRAIRSCQVDAMLATQRSLHLASPTDPIVRIEQPRAALGLPVSSASRRLLTWRRTATNAATSLWRSSAAPKGAAASDRIAFALANSRFSLATPRSAPVDQYNTRYGECNAW